MHWHRRRLNWKMTVWLKFCSYILYRSPSYEGTEKTTSTSIAADATATTTKKSWDCHTSEMTNCDVHTCSTRRCDFTWSVAMVLAVALPDFIHASLISVALKLSQPDQGLSPQSHLLIAARTNTQYHISSSKPSMCPVHSALW